MRLRIADFEMRNTKYDMRISEVSKGLIGYYSIDALRFALCLPTAGRRYAITEEEV